MTADAQPFRPVESPDLRGSSASGAGRALYLNPVGLLDGTAASAAVDAGIAVPLAGGPRAFTAVELLVRETAGGATTTVMPVDRLDAWAAEQDAGIAGGLAATMASLRAAREPLAGLPLDRPRLMGIVNVTPDSFSDGGRHAGTEAAVAHGRALAEAGATVLDVGGESTRPGAEPVPEAEEIARVVPVIEALAGEGHLVSIDTRHAAVMEAALDAGAALVNDVTALAGDPRSLSVVADRGVPVILMHMQGEPQTMQKDPRYACAPLDVVDFLAGRIAACEAAGIPRGRIMVDPGIGFGKSVAHNCQILGRTGLLHGLGCAILMGVSRKSLIGKLSRDEPATDRLPGSLAAAFAGLDRGAQMARVHDVAETAQFLAVTEAARPL